MDIYMVRNHVNGKLYIGQSSLGTLKRWKQHCSASRGKKGRIEKYGEENFSVETLFTVNKEMAERFGSMVPAGYNVSTGKSSDAVLSNKDRLYVQVGPDDMDLCRWRVL